MTKTLFAGLALACAAALSGCNTAGGLALTGNPVADAKTAAASASPQQFVADLKAFNDALGQSCGGWGNLDWNPPLPPTGSIHAQCAIGKQPGASAPPEQINPFTLAPLAAPPAVH